MMQIIYWIWNERILVLWALQLDWWQIEYDENGNIIERPNKHNIENLDTIEKDLKFFFSFFFKWFRFQSYRKIYYKESEAVAHQTAEELQAWMQENDIQVEGSRYLNPLITFDDLCIYSCFVRILSGFHSSSSDECDSTTRICDAHVSSSISIVDCFENHLEAMFAICPLWIQCDRYSRSFLALVVRHQSNRQWQDIHLFVAHDHACSGSTVFLSLLKLILDVHRALQPGDGPIALILVPTRELAEQVQMEAKKYLQPYDVKV